MAQIKIIGNVLNSVKLQRYTAADVALVTSSKIVKEFNPDTDYIEFFLYDLANNLLSIDYNYKNYNTLPSSLNLDGSLSVIEIDPAKDIQSAGYNSGEFKVQYNYFRNRISDISADLFISEISSDRTEIRATSINIAKDILSTLGNQLVSEINNSPYYVDFLLDFGNNYQAVAVNIAVEILSTQTNILFKLYQPLPNFISTKSSFWVTEEICSADIFDIDLSTLIVADAIPSLRGANFDIVVPNHNTISTEYQDYDDLVVAISKSALTSYQQYLSVVDDKSLMINVDYTDIGSFSHFGSAKTRLEKFYTKVKQIEDYNNYVSASIHYTGSFAVNSGPLSGTIVTGPLISPYLTQNLTNVASNRETIISQFDGFERYMYFESGAYAWPKTSSLRPYQLKSTSSAEVVTWYSSRIDVATNYDSENLDHLWKIIPEYILEDDKNQPYLDFVNMVGHYFDNIWIYIKSVTDLYKNDNNLYDGVSKDIVYYQLKSLGEKLYNGDAGGDNSDYLTGNYKGSPAELASLTSSYLNAIPKRDLVAELYKRIYHNLPDLVKSKGTKKGLQELITIFGITSSILNVKEFGGEPTTLDEINYSNNKIRIVSSSLEGSQLSSFRSIKQSSISSSREPDTHIIDVSFSPQNQIDAAISSSLVGWTDLDDLIGDPSDEYSSSYTALNNMRFAAISSSFITKFDYNGFIQLLQYFDNSLFQMLKDYIPARAKLLTGVTYRPQTLERVKLKRYKPITENIKVVSGSVAAPIISEDSDYVEYNYAKGIKSSFYNGEFEGNEHDIYDIYLTASYNPWLHFSASLDNTIFNSSEFSTLLNNVSSSRLSTIVKLLDGKLSSSYAELEDSDEDLYTFKTSRYEGCKTLSKTYNTWSGGDTSFGKTAAIDQFVKKIGFFTEVSESNFLTNRNNTHLKYLVDQFGGFTELNQKNKNWEEVQNTFIANETTIISLFNNQQFGNQRTSDGDKHIYNSGYSYHPMLYFYADEKTDAYYNSTILTETPEQRVYFNSNPSLLAKTFFAYNNPSGSNYISGSSSDFYHFSGSRNVVPNIFNLYNLNEEGCYVPGNSVSIGKYNDNLTIGASLSASFAINLNFQTGSFETASFTFRVIDSFLGTILTETVPFTSSQYVKEVDKTNYTFHSGSSWATASWPIPTFLINSNGDIDATIAPNTDITPGRWGDLSTGNTVWLYLYNNKVYGDVSFTSSGTALVTAEFLPFTNSFSSGKFNVKQVISLDSGHSQSFELKLDGISVTNYTASISEGGLLITPYQYVFDTIQPYATDPFDFNNMIYPEPNTPTFSFTPLLSRFYEYQYLPESSSNLYSKYGDVDVAFVPKKDDILVLGYNGLVKEYTIQEVGTTSSVNGLNGKILQDITVFPPFPNNVSSASFSQPGSFVLLLSKQKDETNIILNFDKKAGRTSFGLLVPKNIHPDVLSNIDAITNQIKQKIISDNLPL